MGQRERTKERASRARTSARAACGSLLAAAVAAALPGGAAAAPWDGPRALADGRTARRLVPVPGRFAVTWAPGVEASWPSGLPAEDGPERIEVAGHVLRKLGPLGPPRYHCAEYALEGVAAAPGSDVGLRHAGPVARAILALPGVSGAAPLLRLDEGESAPFRAALPRVLLQLATPLAEEEMRRAAEALGLSNPRRFGLAPDQFLLDVPPGAAVDPADAATRLMETASLRWAQPDWLEPRASRFTPTDPEFPDQWHLHNTGQGGGEADNDVDAVEAWDIALGDPDVIVAVLDSGVDTDHPDLEGALLPGWDVLDGDDDPSPDGLGSHGTSVAGLMAAPAQGTGVVGGCPGCSILPIRMLGASSSGEAEAIDWAVSNGAWVINNSWGPVDGTGTTAPIPPVVASAIDNAVTNGRDGLGTAIFWAAGNGHPIDSCSQDGYVSYPSVIAVGASTNEGERSDYSEMCPELDVSAPSSGGTEALTTTTVGGYTGSFGGTSGASPVAAGVGGLVLSGLPGLSWDQLLGLLEGSADVIDVSGGNYDASGHSDAYGFGRVNAASALQAELAFLSVVPIQATCGDALDVEVQIPTAGGLGSVIVTASSETEPAAESFTLVEGDPGIYSGSLPLGGGPAAAGDGLLSVSDGDTVTIVSADADAERLVAVDCAGPEIFNVQVDNLTPWGARILWETSEPADGYAAWGAGSEQEAEDEAIELIHQIWAIGLTPCTEYTALLRSADARGNSTEVAEAATWTSPGDPAELPDDAPEDADPCDPSTWKGDDDDDATPDDDTAPLDDDDGAAEGRDDDGMLSGQGNGCTCAGSLAARGGDPPGPDSAPGASLAGVLLLWPWLRRRAGSGVRHGPHPSGRPSGGDLRFKTSGSGPHRSKG
jgi:subtilisin family serine protease